MVKILIATRNAGKQREYVELFQDIPAEFVILSDLRITTKVPETASSYEENALLKAEAYARESRLLTLAHDSGLEVDALDGAPGVYSARYAEAGSTDTDRYQKLLSALENVPEEQRTARFKCTVALCTQTGDVHTETGICEGRIGWEPRGTNGFGYDPVFIVEGYGVTMAELPSTTKNQISHRARALQAITPVLYRVLGLPY